MKVQYKEVETVNEFIDAIKLRIEVFVREQGFEPGWEPDEDDKKASISLQWLAEKSLPLLDLGRLNLENTK